MICGCNGLVYFLAKSHVAFSGKTHDYFEMETLQIFCFIIKKELFFLFKGKKMQCLSHVS